MENDSANISPLTLVETRIRKDSAVYPGGVVEPAIRVQFVARRSDPNGGLETVTLPPLYMDRSQLQEVLEGLQRALDQIGGPMDTHPGPGSVN